MSLTMILSLPASAQQTLYRNMGRDFVRSFWLSRGQNQEFNLDFQNRAFATLADSMFGVDFWGGEECSASISPEQCQSMVERCETMLRSAKAYAAELGMELRQIMLSQTTGTYVGHMPADYCIIPQGCLPANSLEHMIKVMHLSIQYGVPIFTHC